MHLDGAGEAERRPRPNGAPLCEGGIRGRGAVCAELERECSERREARGAQDGYRAEMR